MASRTLAAKASRTTTRTLPFDAPHYVLHLLAAISRFRDVELDKALAPLGLTVARYRALNAIVVFEPCHMGELAEFIGADRTAMTRAVDQLVESGLVERSRQSSDRRQVMLTATEAGQRTTAAARPIVFTLNRRVLEGVSSQAQSVIIEAEQQMFANLAKDPRAISRMLSLRRSSADDETT
jgi:DNA-binding MarR family transcriptional regulator